ncbi:TIGR02449 family protein [Exilibacterium tricleocarpae]|uniref:TIGR02449 family protein n=1 Tax=Exilibacterium tricleocarpae TaxID=2591008 RepID=A0A545SXK8_9GAMM|nr:TIGR02449 family protein [Exilibacterium tricleocarpae]TQV69697.1 TIGR02449 family protein [Exilibacterium tricleocarpae]
MTDHAFGSLDLQQSLETKLDKLVVLCEHLLQENQSLKTRESDWLRERTRLMEKNELARTRVEAMITRLKSLEEET